MTHFSNTIGPNGPLLTVFIGSSIPRENALKLAGAPVPQAQLAHLLIDTGASHTSIDIRFVSLLGLLPTGTIAMHTPSTGAVPKQVETYDISLAFAGHAQAIHSLAAHSVMACDFSGQGIDGLLGRDILATSRLTYSGPDNAYYLSF